MADDYSFYFKNEASPYLWLPLEKMRQDYVEIEVMGYPVDGQTRPAFWVISDGEKTLLYFSTGLAEVVSNYRFTVVRVARAKETKIVEGRLLYLMDESTPWKDLGPITKEGRRESDSDFEGMRQAHLKNKTEVLDIEEKKQLKKAMKHDFWTKGGAF